MTDGHRHWTLKVKRGGVVDRTLRGTTVYTTTNQHQAQVSRFVYKPGPRGYRLSLLGLLHGLVGLVVAFEEE